MGASSTSELSACRKDRANLADAEGPGELSVSCQHKKPCRKKQTNKTTKGQQQQQKVTKWFHKAWDASSETQGQIVGARENLNRWKNKAQKKSKERPEKPLGTMSYQTSSKRSLQFWLLIGARKTQVFRHQSEAGTAATVLELVW